MRSVGEVERVAQVDLCNISKVNRRSRKEGGRRRMDARFATASDLYTKLIGAEGAAVAERLEQAARVCALCMRLDCHEFESRPGISERRFRILVGNNGPLKSSRCYGTPNRHQPNSYPTSHIVAGSN